MAEFGSLWVGGPLKKLQQTCLSSFVYHGHEMNLFVYDMNMEVPHGVIKRDARELVDESDIFLVQNTYAAFSDVFRYRMVDKTDLIWADADTLCCSDDWSFFKDETLFSREYGNDLIVPGVLSLPKDSLISKYLVRKSTNFDKETMHWAEIGPLLLTDAAHKFGLEDYAQDPKVLCMITMSDAPKFWNKRYAREIISKTKDSETKSASLYNGMLTVFGNTDTNKLPKGSAMEFFYNKYVLKKKEIVI